MSTSPRYWIAFGPEHPAWAQYTAWWGKEIIQHIIWVQSRSDDMDDGDQDGDQGSDQGSDMDLGSDVDTWVQKTIIDISEREDEQILGEILLRQEFIDARNFVELYASKYPDLGLVITGQPGIGKTYFLWYLLRYRLSQRLPTMFALGEVVYFFHETGAYYQCDGPQRIFLSHEAKTVSKPHLLWSLFDRMNRETEPDRMLWAGGLFPVQTSSPDPSRFKGWIKQRCGDIYTMNPWDKDELTAGLSLQQNFEPGPINFPLLDAACYKYGPVPRDVYKAYRLRDEIEISGRDEATMEAIHHTSQSFDLLKSMVSSTSRLGRSSEISNKVICMWRRDAFRAYALVLSPFVWDELLKAEAFASMDKKRQVCELFSGIPEMGVARGYAFQKYGHSCLSRDDSPSFATYQLTRASKSKFRYDRTTGLTATPYPRANRKIRPYASPDDFHHYPPLDTEFCFPILSNNPGFDSFVVTQAAVYIFQLTVSRTHRVDSRTQKGLPLLKQVVPLDRPWYYFLVVPQMDPDLVTLTAVDEKWNDRVESFQLIVLDMHVA